MKIQCKYCESWINDTDEVCENCGGVNEELKRVANGVPTTIDELKLFCRAHNLPLAKMRFYIGENYKLPKAFGIYKDEASGEFVVYKNKADGSRAIRYQGKDEAYAVNEIYLKLKDEIQNQKAKQSAARQNAARQSNTRQSAGYTPSSNTRYTRKRRMSPWLVTIFMVIVLPTLFEMAVFAFAEIRANFRPDTGYYHYQDDYYYYYDNDWYKYDDSSSNWLETTIDDALEDNYDSYFSSYSYDSSYDAYDFEDSSYYEEPDYSSYDDDDDWSSSSWDDDWDSDYDWDSGSDWDSGYSDWDSDW